MNFSRKATNPRVKRQHYQFAFSVSPRHAQRLINADRTLLGRISLFFEDFLTLYGFYPCPKYKPVTG